MIHAKFYINLFCVLLGFNFFPENNVGLRFMFKFFFMLNYLIFLSKLPTQLSIFFLLNKQPLEELLKILTVFFGEKYLLGFLFQLICRLLVCGFINKRALSLVILL